MIRKDVITEVNLYIKSLGTIPGKVVVHPRAPRPNGPFAIPRIRVDEYLIAPMVLPFPTPFSFPRSDRICVLPQISSSHTFYAWRTGLLRIMASPLQLWGEEARCLF